MVDVIEFLTCELYGAEGDGSQQSQRATVDRYALNRPHLRRADALRNVPMDVSAATQNNTATSTAREPSTDPVSGGITLTGATRQQWYFSYDSQCCFSYNVLVTVYSQLAFYRYRFSYS